MSDLFPLLTPASQVSLERPQFLIQDRIPLGVVSLLAGVAGEGKSTLALHWVAQGTKGELPGEYAGQPIQVLVSASEDAKALQNARLTAAGADLDRVAYLDMASMVAGEIVEQQISFPRDMLQIRDRLEYTGAKLWIIDPITSIIPGDSNNRDAVRSALDPLHGLARDLGISIVGIAHFSKGQGPSRDRMSGSHAFRDVARAYLPLVADEETGNRVYTLEKSNYSTAVGTSWEFRLEDTEVTAEDGQPIHVGRVVDLGETDLTVDQIINRDAAGDSEDIPADEWLEEHLTRSGGEAKAADIFRAGREDGYSESTLKRARKKLGIRSQREGFKGGSTWSFPIQVTPKKEDDPNGSDPNGKPAPLQQETVMFPSIQVTPARDPNGMKKTSPAPPVSIVVGTHPTYGPLVKVRGQIIPQDPDGWQQWRRDGKPELQEAS